MMGDAAAVGPARADRPGGGERVHLRFLDGLRGVAALYVVLHHFLSWSAEGVSRPLRLAVAWTEFGHFTVDVFIVLSGFSLMLPVATAADRSLRGGVGNYLKRRAKRILPPYYAALVLSVLVIVGIEVWSAPGHAPRWRELTDLSPGSLVSHVLLVHNLHDPWNMSINMAHWSVATEWQIYFLFPLLLLPVWRRWGSGWAVAVGLAVGMLPHLLMAEARNLDWACPWFVGLFAMGMGVADCFARDGATGASRPRLWFWGAVACAVAYVAAKVTLHGMRYAWTRDVCAGAFAAMLIGWCAISLRRAGGRRPPGLVRLLESRPCVALGAFSYSLYLTHCAVLLVLLAVGRRLHLTPDAALGMRALVGVPGAVAVAFAFYWLFERPFLGKRARIEARVAAPQMAAGAEAVVT